MLTQGVGLAFTGVLIGLSIALASSKWLQPVLFKQSATDVVTYALVGGVMLLVSGFASLAAALRAARTDPAAVLRGE